jgi:16S rRNA processing protein RimM
MPSGKRVIVGRVGGVYGVRGWVKIHSFTTPPEGLFAYSPWFLLPPSNNTGSAGQNSRSEQVKLLEFRPHGKFFVAHFEGYDDRERATLVSQRDIEVSEVALPSLPEGEYYWQQMYGLNVCIETEGSELLLGKVSSHMETGANDVMEVVPCQDSLDDRTRLLPFVPGVHVLKIDLVAGKIMVDWDPDF